MVASCIDTAPAASFGAAKAGKAKPVVPRKGVTVGPAVFTARSAQPQGRFRACRFRRVWSVFSPRGKTFFDRFPSPTPVGGKSTNTARRSSGLCRPSNRGTHS